MAQSESDVLLTQSDLRFYYRIARKLALELPGEVDRVKAFKWINKICTAKATMKLKTHTIFLLIHSLNRKRLVGPFEEMPRDDKSFQKYKLNLQPADISNLLIRKEMELAGNPPISVDVSGDLCEVAAYQEIPSFGAHFYYACSPEKLAKWNNTGQYIIPKGLLNVTVVSKPNLSILHKEVHIEEASKRKLARSASLAADSNFGQFVDASIVDTNMDEFKKGFVSEQPVAAGCVQMDALRLAEMSGVVRPEDIAPSDDMVPEGEKILSPHVESVQITGGSQSLNLSTKGAACKTDKEELAQVADQNDAEAFNRAKDNMLSQLPCDVREHLVRKLSTIKPRQESPAASEFRPASAVFSGSFDYQAPTEAIRRGPRPSGIPLGRSRSARGTKRASLSQTPRSSTQSYQGTNLERRQYLLNRLEQLKTCRRDPNPLNECQQQAEPDPEETVFERFVYEELPHAEHSYLQEDEMYTSDLCGSQNLSEIPQRDLSILREEDMYTGDLFGSQNVSTIPRRDMSILREDEMYTDDLFGSQNLSDIPKRNLSILRDEEMYTGDLFASQNTTPRDLSILREEDMHTSDLFASQNLSAISKPNNSSILHSHELQTDDFFGQDQVMDPNDAFNNCPAEERYGDSKRGESFLSEGQMYTDDMFGTGNAYASFRDSPRRRTAGRLAHILTRQRGDDCQQRDR